MYEFNGASMRRAAMHWLLALSCLLSAASAARAQAPEIWFHPKQEAINPNHQGFNYATHDFPEMISDPQAWKTAASRLAGIDLGIVHMVERYPDLAGIVRWTDQLKMRISGGGSAMFTNRECPTGPVEGVSIDHDFAHELVGNLHLWAKAGGRLDDLALDSPFFFGYYYLQRVCHFSIATVAQRTAATVNRILADFPNARIVDAEGPGPATVPQFLADYAQFVRVFDATARKPIARLSMDLHYTDAWHTGYHWVPAARTIAAWAHQAGLQVGFLMDAEDRFVETPDGSVVTGQPVTNDLWLRMVREHMLLAKQARLPLDYIEIVSWMKFPMRNLPETDPESFTSLVNDAYAIWHAK